MPECHFRLLYWQCSSKLVIFWGFLSFTNQLKAITVRMSRKSLYKWKRWMVYWNECKHFFFMSKSFVCSLMKEWIFFLFIFIRTKWRFFASTYLLIFGSLTKFFSVCPSVFLCSTYLSESDLIFNRSFLTTGNDNERRVYKV